MTVDTVLLIEDDPRIVDILQRGLVAEGYAIAIANTGGEGFERAMAGEGEVIVLDLLLPDWDGREVCKALRRAGVATPVMMLTALDALEDKIEGLQIGADDYLTKPFAFDELVARIAALLRRRGPFVPPDSAHRHGRMRLDVRRRTAHIGDRLLELTPREFALLEYLMRYAGEVRGRDDIVRDVWGYDEDPMTNVVDVYVRHLRRKLESYGERDVIVTVRGHGYGVGIDIA